MSTYDYQFINTYEGTRSPTGRVESDFNTAYFTRCLYQRAISTLKFNIPAEWDKQYFLNTLYRNGYIAIIPTAKYGIIPQICTLSGIGLYLQPTRVLVAQPLVDFDGVIGTDCEIIKLTPDYEGIWDIVEHYAVQLSECQKSVMCSLENTRLAFILAAKNKSANETLKVVLEKMSAGEPAIVIDRMLKEDMDEGESLFTAAYNPKDFYLTDSLLDNMSSIINSFDREIGIPTVDQKKERMITGEVTNMISDSCSRLETWKTCLTESIDNVNRLYPELNISFTETRKEIIENELNAESDTAGLI